MGSCLYGLTRFCQKLQGNGGARGDSHIILFNDHHAVPRYFLWGIYFGVNLVSLIIHFSLLKFLTNSNSTLFISGRYFILGLITETINANEHNLVKNSNWLEADRRHNAVVFDN